MATSKNSRKPNVNGLQFLCASDVGNCKHSPDSREKVWVGYKKNCINSLERRDLKATGPDKRKRVTPRSVGEIPGQGPVILVGNDFEYLCHSADYRRSVVGCRDRALHPNGQ